MQELLSIGTAIATVVAILVGVVATIMVAYAGLMYATAAGDPQKTGIAKNAFIGAFIGLIIAGVAFIGPRIVTDMVIKPVGGVAIETEIGLNCDGILRNQLVFQRGASTADRMNMVISRIQAQHTECASDVWEPEVVDIVTSGTTKVGRCFSDSDGEQGDDDSVIGDSELPDGFLVGATGAKKVRLTSGRDSKNNILVYWADTAGARPSDGASCWLYIGPSRYMARESLRSQDQLIPRVFPGCKNLEVSCSLQPASRWRRCLIPLPVSSVPGGLCTHPAFSPCGERRAMPLPRCFLRLA